MSGIAGSYGSSIFYIFFKGNTCLAFSIRITQESIKITNIKAFKPLNFLIEKI